MEMIGPNNSWHMKTTAEIKARLSGANSIKACKRGTLHITIEDGTQYTVTEGELNVVGIVYGDIMAYISGNIVITDVTNSMEAVIQLDPD